MFTVIQSLIRQYGNGEISYKELWEEIDRIIEDTDNLVDVDNDVSCRL